ncbi:MAG: protein kinase [Gloeocapsa sp. DLM2.Bin57]|nr:MAG: protein kinase [Gloeocapsa sp. DLM2.Bin57]
MKGQLLKQRYRIINELVGTGGMGQTYVAEDTQQPDNPTCVVKHLKPANEDPNFLITVKRLFKSEAEILEQLGKHDQIPQLRDYFEEDQEFYLVQEFIDGQPLSAELPLGKRWLESEVVSLLKNMLEILEFIHSQGVIHRDIKPDNIIRREKDGKLVLIDFGVVKQMRMQQATGVGQISMTVGIGTPGYMPIEQSKGKPRPSSDIYSLGMVAIQALTGLLPSQLREDEDGELIWRDQAEVKEELASVVTKMTRYHFKDRYQSASEVISDLKKLKESANAKESGYLPTRVIEEGGYKPTQVVETESDKPISRNKFLKWGVLGGGGAIGAVVLNKLLLTSSSTSTPIPTPNPTSNTFSFDVITVDSYGNQINQENKSAKYQTLDLGNGVELELVSIPGGEFLMGSPNSELGRYKHQEQQHRVTVPGFWLGKYPVTQAQWGAIMGNNPYTYPNNPYSFLGEKRPVQSVSWNDCVEFCQKLSQKLGKDISLPSEAQWEYACKAGTTTPFHFGETITTDLANYNSEYFRFANEPVVQSRRETTEVGIFPPNAFGLYDMHGNIQEWCLDQYHESYDGAPTDGSAWIDDANNHLLRRVLRGGSWNNLPRDCRSARRDSDLHGISFFGFRLVLRVGDS